MKHFQCIHCKLKGLRISQSAYITSCAILSQDNGTYCLCSDNTLSKCLLHDYQHRPFFQMLFIASSKRKECIYFYLPVRHLKSASMFCLYCNNYNVTIFITMIRKECQSVSYKLMDTYAMKKAVSADQVMKTARPTAMTA